MNGQNKRAAEIRWDKRMARRAQDKNQMAQLRQPIVGMENMTPSQVFGATVKQLRTQNDWTQIELAVKAGLHQSIVSPIERGRDVPLNTAEKIAHAFGVELYEML